jgi:D-alanine-D-alanine ligase
MAKVAHDTLGCRGVSRSDFRYDDTADGEPNRLYLLEVNTQPGMTPLSLVPEQAKYRGISFPELVAWMVENARCDA